VASSGVNVYLNGVMKLRQLTRNKYYAKASQSEVIHTLPIFFIKFKATVL
jgi:hypothetical protein